MCEVEGLVETVLPLSKFYVMSGGICVKRTRVAVQ